MDKRDFDKYPIAFTREKVAKHIAELRIAGRTLEEEKLKKLPNNFEEREYQLESWAAIWEARNDGKKEALLHLATGLGKTSVAVLDVMKFQQERKEQNKTKPKVLFVSHQANLLGQAKERFLDFLPHSSTKQYKTGKDDLPEADITFATFQSLRNELGRFPSNHFDYIIYDEAHHTQADTYSDVVEYFDPEFQLALTATPERADEKDIREHFGEPVYSKTLPEAMAEGLVADVDYHIVLDDAIKKAVEEGFNPTTLKEIKELLSVDVRNEVIAKNILEEREKIGLEDAKTIIFCSDIEHANTMAELLDGDAYHSGVHKKERDDILKRFKNGELQTITVKDMFNEGVDVPDARLIVFLRSTQSKTVFEQQLGRGLRKLPGKDVVSVLDFVANIERLSMLQEIIDKVKERNEELGETTSESYEGVSRDGFNIETSHDIFEFDSLSIEILEKLRTLNEQNTKNITDEEIIELALALNPNRPMTIAEMSQLSSEGRFPSPSTIYARFGSVLEFHKKCGFDIRDFSSLTKNDIVDLAKSISPNQALGRKEIDALSKDNKFLSSGKISELFGSLIHFQRACGFNTLSRNMSRDAMIELALILSPDRPLSGSDIAALSKEKKFVSQPTIVKRFGSLADFHNACGFSIKKDYSRLSKEEILELADRLSPDTIMDGIYISELANEGLFPSLHIIRKTFGSLKSFQKECDASVEDFSQWQESDYIERAKRLQPDKPLSLKDIEEFAKLGVFPSYSSVRKVFGDKSLKDFHKMCGFEVKDFQGITPEDIIHIILETRPEKPITTVQLKKLQKEGLLPSLPTVLARFNGSIANLNKACGFDD